MARDGVRVYGDLHRDLARGAGAAMQHAVVHKFADQQPDERNLVAINSAVQRAARRARRTEFRPQVCVRQR